MTSEAKEIARGACGCSWCEAGNPEDAPMSATIDCSMEVALRAIDTAVPAALRRSADVFESWQNEEYEKTEVKETRHDALVRGGMLAEVARELRATADRGFTTITREVAMTSEAKDIAEHGIAALAKIEQGLPLTDYELGVSHGLTFSARRLDTAVQAGDARIAELETERAELYRSISDLTRSVDSYDAIGEYRQLPTAMHDAVSDVILDALPGEGDKHDALHKARKALLALEMKPRPLSTSTPDPPTQGEGEDNSKEKPLREIPLSKEGAATVLELMGETPTQGGAKRTYCDCDEPECGKERVPFSRFCFDHKDSTYKPWDTDDGT